MLLEGALRRNNWIYVFCLFGVTVRSHLRDDDFDGAINAAYSVRLPPYPPTSLNREKSTHTHKHKSLQTLGAQTQVDTNKTESACTE